MYVYNCINSLHIVVNFVSRVFQKILTTMMPTEEEKTRILEAQMSNHDIPLGPAE